MKSNNENKRHKLNEELVLPIISDGVIASPRYPDHRFIPILIIDTSRHESVNDLVLLHEQFISGDVESTWAIDQKNENVYLFLDFAQPVKTEAILKFEISQHGALIDTIMSSKCFYLQPGKKGDRPSNSTGNPSITIEVPDESLKKLWAESWRKSLIKTLRQKGLSRKEAKKASQSMIDEWRSSFGVSIKECVMKHSKR